MYYGQPAQENKKCYASLEEYIKRCTAPANTLPTSFLQIAEVIEEGERLSHSINP